MKKIIATLAAPQAIGPYSQAIKCADTLYVSGQIALDPQCMQMVEGIEAQIRQAFANLGAILEEATMGFANVVKLNIYLTDLSHFALVNSVMEELFAKPYPARAAIGVNNLPRAALVEVDAIAVATC
ncbi:Rid family detoxifying hydrolase [Pseudomonas sp. B21-040]|jgi:reactive intermediate/imine deaminase|uniref:Rid family detoxifying hydrolase n=1 Tax=unclassified Pseudomonas TaxID=196821 RepID=UPI001CBDC17A|nr:MULTISPECIES: Rid family detoxifying hydrolase [unclassified Pseudomonas]UVL39706.1 Rid family detoxifying hydrolase [Pseudomonas sp. B21-040]